MSEIIPVIINGKSYDSHIDQNGVQRFIGNRIVAKYVDTSIRAYDDCIRTGNSNLAPFTLNSIDYRPGVTYTLDELIEFSTLHGYSVSGLCDLSFMEGVTVENPFWD